MDHYCLQSGHRLLMRCLKRTHPSRAAHLKVQLDPSAASALQTLQYRRHPGVVQPKMVRLPERLAERISKVFRERQVHNLADQVKYLTNYLSTRKRPTEGAELRAAAEYFTRQLSSEDYDSLDPDAQTKLEEKVKNKLKKNIYHWRPISYDENMSMVYLASRMAPNYATTYRVLHEIKKRLPDFQPSTVLDFGSGVGSTIWAMDSLFPGSVKEYYCVDISQAMNDLSRNLLLRPGSTGEADSDYIIPGVYQRFFLPVSPKVSYDITISSHSLLEVPSHEERMKLIEILWKKTNDFLVLIETGSLEGYYTLMEIRNYILSKSLGEEGGERVDPAAVGHLFAPCPHDVMCPRLARDSVRPCNFELSYEPLAVPGIKRQVKQMEQFSYLVMRKGKRKEEEAAWPRVIDPVLIRSRHIICRLCNGDGNLREVVITKTKHEKSTNQSVLIRSRHIICRLCNGDGNLREVVITKTKHEKDLYRTARYTQMGDLLPIRTNTEDPNAREGDESVEDLEEEHSEHENSDGR